MTVISDEMEMLSRYLHAMDVPDGLRAEIIGGRIVMSPIGRGGHALTIDMVADQLKAASPKGLWVTGSVQFRAPHSGEEPIPDLSVVPEAALREDETFYLMDIAELVVEVGSASTVKDDRNAKRKLYAAENVPLYLLVDRLESTVTLYSGPKDGDYLNRNTVAYGGEIPVPAPFNTTLRTADFPPYVQR